MRFILSIVLVLFTASLYSIEYNTYELVNVKEFKASIKGLANEGDLALASPSDITVDGPGIYFHKNFFAIYEQCSEPLKINLYNKNYELEETIESSFFDPSGFLKLDDYTLYYRYNFKISIFDNNLNLISSIRYWNDYPEDIRNLKSFFYHDSVLFIHDNKYNLWSIKNPGLDNKKNRQNLVGEEETLALINSGEIEGLTVDSKKRLFLDGELQTIDLKTYAEFNKNTRDINKKPKTEKEFNEDYFYKGAGRSTLLGKDNDRNTYWYYNGGLLIIDTNGWPIMVFTITDSKKSDTLPAVSPEGDVYFLDYGKDKVTLYKVERQW